ncbi:subtilisin-like protein [Lactarius psammicola]|nr:subtilisin-like protein [Lactarius psammicola]
MRYNWLSALSVLSAGPLCPLATPLQPHWGSMRVKHAWNAVPPNWEPLGHPAAETTIDLHIALKSQHENALIDALYEVSTPKHPKYGAHLSKEQVARLVAPHPDTIELVNSWLEHYGVPSSSVSTSHGGSWLTLTGVPVSQANDLLGTSYQLYQHVETKDCVLRTLGYALPEVLHAHVQTVAPTTYFGSPRTPRQTLRKRSGGEMSGELVKVLSNRVNGPGYVTPSYLRELYNTEGYAPAATDRNVLGIVGYHGDYPSQDDLATFMREYRTDGVDARFTLVRIRDRNLPGKPQPNPNQEANVDIQYTEAIAYPTPHIYYSTVNSGKLSYLAWLIYMTKQPTVPQTISTSYGDNEQDFAEDYATALCNLFAQLGARGASVIFSTGDDGVGRGDCIVNDGSGRVQFLPTFPASCPWITSVGGTINPEVAAAFSSGGFSNYFKRPRYQDIAMRFFLQDIGNQHYGLYNASSRGFPDIAAQADYFAHIFNGEIRFYGGTSCSAPTVAGVISLLNDYQLSKGKSPLGWLNPWLYSEGLVGLKDIMYGSNPGCNTDGFPAIAGWDPVTGLGTPYFDRLKHILDSQ